MLAALTERVLIEPPYFLVGTLVVAGLISCGLAIYVALEYRKLLETNHDLQDQLKLSRSHADAVRDYSQKMREPFDEERKAYKEAHQRMEGMVKSARDNADYLTDEINRQQRKIAALEGKIDQLTKERNGYMKSYSQLFAERMKQEDLVREIHTLTQPPVIGASEASPVKKGGEAQFSLYHHNPMVRHMIDAIFEQEIDSQEIDNHRDIDSEAESRLVAKEGMDDRTEEQADGAERNGSEREGAEVGSGVGSDLHVPDCGSSVDLC